MKPATCALVVSVLLFPAPTCQRVRGGETALRFEVSMAAGLLDAPRDGRLLIMLGKQEGLEPRRVLAMWGETGIDSWPVLGRDVLQFAPGKVGVVDGRALTFPIPDLAHLPVGDYWVQGLFDWNPDMRLPIIPLYYPIPPGTLYSEPRRVHLDPARDETVKLELTKRAPDEGVPEEDEYNKGLISRSERRKYVKIRSELLSAFHRRPMYLYAGVLLPRGFAEQPNRRYPLRVHIHGFGGRYFLFESEEQVGDGMVLLQLDGAGPLGDPMQVNSDNNGPYGDALTRELIPYVEKRFRCIGKPYARVLDGGSTGGWVSLALQVFYPDYFNGAWANCPDPVDFRSFQLLDIYRDPNKIDWHIPRRETNAYVNEFGFERPGKRTLQGDVVETMRYQCQLENVLGRGDSWTMSGQQWGTWNAVYGARGADGRPVPLWDPRTGALNYQAVEHWKRYDLRLVMERNWQTLGPKLRRKIHISAGEADNYFLNNAVHQLDAFLTKAKPAYGGWIHYGAGQGHGWRDLTEKELVEQMLEAVGAGRND